MAHGGATLRPGSVTWLAAADGIGHARLAAKDWNAACGVRLTLERLSHPIRQRCLTCLERVGITVSARVAPEPGSLRAERDPAIWTETELRLAHGDR